MGDKVVRKMFMGALLVSLLSAQALHAGGTQVTLDDAIWDFEQDQLDNQVGDSITATGDFNNDGFADLVVASRFYNSGLYRSGVVWVFYGSENGPSTTPNLTINPPQLAMNGFFGEVVATLNVDGDEYDDLLVGMTNYDVNANWDEGAVFLYYGSDTGLDGSYDWKVTGTALYAHTGLEAASAGDIDNDGYDDIIIGARRYDACNGTMPIINHAYVFMGSESLLGDTTVATADWYAMGDQCVPFDDAGFGINVGSAGDVNGDGYGDIFVGAPLYDAGQANEGKLFVWHGSDTGLGDTGSTANADWTAEGDQADARLGTTAQTAVVSADLNGDGYDDLIAGSRLYDHLQSNDGVVAVWYGSDTGLGASGTPSNADWLTFGGLGDQLGSNVRVLDYNGDGLHDLLIGCLGHMVGADSAAGMGLIWLGNEDGPGMGGSSAYADWMVEGDQASSYLGWSLTAGDMNGDGEEAVFIVAPYYDLVYKDAGKVWAFPGEAVIFSGNFETGDTLRWE
ncbi:MAG: integrin alpha [Thermoanaerobaculia bacterium]